MRIIAAMSGGVDSAVAAARAVEAGHDVTGIHLALSRNPASYRTGARGCCTIEDSNDARRAADVIGIPFYVWDLSDRFHEDVVEDFMDEYAAGRTPNPCLRCNEKIKFAAVLDRALALGFDAVATGHYAQLRTGDDGLIELHRAVDHGKDQSYVLGVLDQQQLAHSLFPLGDTSKPLVREEAARRGLLVADKPDSHDICFVADGDNAGWLRDKLGDRNPNTGGDIVDAASGEVLGQHEGTVAYTIGQRRGLRIGRPAPDGKPRFVLDIEPVSGTVTVGPREGLRVDRITGIRPRWCGTVPSLLAGPGVTVQLRAHGAEHRAVVTVEDGRRAGRHRAPRPGRGHRPRPGRRGLRRQPGRRLGDHQRHRPLGGARVSALASGVGSMPGTDDREYAEAVRVVLGELSLPHVPELPGRGAGASMTGRGLAVVAGLGADLQPAGWRLTDAPGIDHRRARSLLAQDLDQVEEQAQGHAGPFKAQVCGPWTLAATVEKPRGDKVLSDHGARRDLAQALAEGVRDHVADLRRRLPGTERLVVQVDEPALPAVLGGQVPTVSGFGRLRRVDLPEASAALEWVLTAITEAGAEPWVHSCAPGVPWSLVHGAGALGLSADLDVLRPEDLDHFAEVDRGRPDRRARHRAVDRAGAASPPTRPSPSGCCAGSTCWVSTTRRPCPVWS